MRVCLAIRTGPSPMTPNPENPPRSKPQKVASITDTAAYVKILETHDSPEAPPPFPFTMATLHPFCGNHSYLPLPTPYLS